MTKRNPLPSYQKVRELFAYEPDTGVLRWKINRAQMKAGDIAGAKRGDAGYLQVSIDGKLYRVHCIIWLWMTGREPVRFLDHRDTIKSNNRWDNLREASRSQNQANVGLSARNTSGFKGVYWYAAYSKWSAQIWKDKRAYFLGYFDTAEAAHAARLVKAQELFGEFARAA